MILPSELFEGHYFCRSQREEHFSRAHAAEDHPTLRHFQKLAAELGVVIPVSFYEKAGPELYNSVAVLDADGRTLGIYRKSHIPDGPGYQEKFYFKPGNTGFRAFAHEARHDRRGDLLGPVVSRSGARDDARRRRRAALSDRDRQRARGARARFSRLVAARDDRPRGRERGRRGRRESHRRRGRRDVLRQLVRVRRTRRQARRAGARSPGHRDRRARSRSAPSRAREHGLLPRSAARSIAR